MLSVGFPGSSVVNNNKKNLPAKAGERVGRFGFDPWSRRSPGEGSGNPVQYSCLKHALDRGAWQAMAHGVTKSWYNWAQHSNSICINIIHIFTDIHTYITSMYYIQVNNMILGLPRGASSKELSCQYRRHKRCGFDPWLGKIPWKRA